MSRSGIFPGNGGGGSSVLVNIKVFTDLLINSYPLYSIEECLLLRFNIFKLYLCYITQEALLSEKYFLAAY